mgnify:CR=1 FL=1
MDIKDLPKLRDELKKAVRLAEKMRSDLHSLEREIDRNTDKISDSEKTLSRLRAEQEQQMNKKAQINAQLADHEKMKMEVEQTLKSFDR